MQLESLPCVTTFRWLTKVRTCRHISCLIPSKGGILHPALPKECLLVPGLKLVAASPADQTLHRVSDLTPHWLQDSALAEDCSHSTQSYALCPISPLGESQQDHGPDHMAVSPGTYFTREQQQLFKSWFMNLQAFCDQDWKADVTAALASRNCDRPFLKGQAKIKKKKKIHESHKASLCRRNDSL